MMNDENDLGLSFITQLKPCVFKYKNCNDNRKHIGFIAQDILKLLPENEYAVIMRDENGFYMINYSELIAPLVKAVQELNVKVQELEEQLKRYGDGR